MRFSFVDMKNHCQHASCSKPPAPPGTPTGQEPFRQMMDPRRKYPECYNTCGSFGSCEHQARCNHQPVGVPQDQRFYTPSADSHHFAKVHDRGADRNILSPDMLKNIEEDYAKNHNACKHQGIVKRPPKHVSWKGVDSTINSTYYKGAYKYQACNNKYHPCYELGPSHGEKNPEKMHHQFPQAQEEQMNNSNRAPFSNNIEYCQDGFERKCTSPNDCANVIEENWYKNYVNQSPRNKYGSEPTTLRTNFRCNNCYQNHKKDDNNITSNIGKNLDMKKDSEIRRPHEYQTQMNKPQTNDNDPKQNSTQQSYYHTTMPAHLSFQESNRTPEIVSFAKPTSKHFFRNTQEMNIQNYNNNLQAQALVYFPKSTFPVEWGRELKQQPIIIEQQTHSSNKPQEKNKSSEGSRKDAKRGSRKDSLRESVDEYDYEEASIVTPRSVSFAGFSVRNISSGDSIQKPSPEPPSPSRSILVIRDGTYEDDSVTKVTSSTPGHSSPRSKSASKEKEQKRSSSPSTSLSSDRSESQDITKMPKRKSKSSVDYQSSRESSISKQSTESSPQTSGNTTKQERIQKANKEARTSVSQSSQGVEISIDLQSDNEPQMQNIEQAEQPSKFEGQIEKAENNQIRDLQTSKKHPSIATGQGVKRRMSRISIIGNRIIVDKPKDDHRNRNARRYEPNNAPVGYVDPRSLRQKEVRRYEEPINKPELRLINRRRGQQERVGRFPVEPQAGRIPAQGVRSRDIQSQNDKYYHIKDPMRFGRSQENQKHGPLRNSQMVKIDRSKMYNQQMKERMKDQRRYTGTYQEQRPDPSRSRQVREPSKYYAAQGKPGARIQPATDNLYEQQIGDVKQPLGPHTPRPMRRKSLNYYNYAEEPTKRPKMQPGFIQDKLPKSADQYRQYQRIDNLYEPRDERNINPQFARRELPRKDYAPIPIQRTQSPIRGGYYPERNEINIVPLKYNNQKLQYLQQQRAAYLRDKHMKNKTTIVMQDAQVQMYPSMHHDGTQISRISINCLQKQDENYKQFNNKNGLNAIRYDNERANGRPLMIKTTSYDHSQQSQITNKEYEYRDQPTNRSFEETVYLDPPKRHFVTRKPVGGNMPLDRVPEMYRAASRRFDNYHYVARSHLRNEWTKTACQSMAVKRSHMRPNYQSAHQEDII